MKWWRRKKEKAVTGAPDGKERRLPENAQLRVTMEAQRKLDTQTTLAAAQRITDETGRRIDRMRRLSNIIREGD